MNTIVIALLTLGGIGLVLSIVLYIVSRKFAIKEDLRVKQICEVLPGANCGGCGFPGCEGLAASCIKAAEKGSLEGVLCPVGGNPVMKKIAAILGLEAAGDNSVRLAVIKCNGSCENRSHIRIYDGVTSCKIANVTSQGETACSYGCLGCGDCVTACSFGALRINQETGLPEVDPNVCVACGACAKACPRHLIEIREVRPDFTGMVVKCSNKDKGIIAKNACNASCIGCKLCEKKCEEGAISVENNLSYIDPSKCTLCGTCVKVCPRHSIQKIGSWASPKNATEENCQD